MRRPRLLYRCANGGQARCHRARWKGCRRHATLLDHRHLPDYRNIARLERELAPAPPADLDVDTELH